MGAPAGEAGHCQESEVEESAEENLHQAEGGGGLPRAGRRGTPLGALAVRLALALRRRRLLLLLLLLRHVIQEAGMGSLFGCRRAAAAAFIAPLFG